MEQSTPFFTIGELPLRKGALMSDSAKALSYFRELCAIPHGTYHIDEISDYLASFAKERGLNVRQDELKNVIIRKGATKGYENEEPVILQGHMDMVAVCDNPAEKDMLKDGLDLAEENGYLYAKGTSLGGDDGIAVAYAMAILDSDDIPHPDLTVIFTVNEEVGMDGALGIDLTDCKAKRLINIDSEEEGVITVSCAGGVRLHGELKGETHQICAHTAFLSVTGLTGGHSGTEIHKGRANGAHLLAEILDVIGEEYDLRLISMNAGEKDNAIPASASAEFAIADLDDPEDFISDIEHLEEYFHKEYAETDDIHLLVGVQLPSETECYTREDSQDFLDYLCEVPDGVVNYNDEIGIVQTSLNLGILTCTSDGLSVDFAIRSSVKAEKDALLKEVKETTEEYDGEVSVFGDYPAWEYVPDSVLLKKTVEVYKEYYGKEPVVTGVHAGLECGILAEKIKDLEAVSIGPNILNIHTTKEKLDLASVERTWQFVLRLLAKKD